MIKGKLSVAHRRKGYHCDWCQDDGCAYCPGGSYAEAIGMNPGEHVYLSEQICECGNKAYTHNGTVFVCTVCAREAATLPEAD